MWSKGAVVVVKRGDAAMADAIEKGLDIKEKSNMNNFYLPKRHTKEELKLMIEDAERDYGTRRTPPKWIRVISEGMAFIVYHISVFVERYLVL